MDSKSMAFFYSGNVDIEVFRSSWSVNSSNLKFVDRLGIFVHRVQHLSIDNALLFIDFKTYTKSIHDSSRKRVYKEENQLGNEGNT